MNVKIREFISCCINRSAKWRIDGELFNHHNFIPNEILEKSVFEWKIYHWEGVSTILIEINTEYHVRNNCRFTNR